MVWYGSQNGHQKDMSSKEIGLCVQNTITITSSVVNIFEGEGVGLI